MSLGPDDIAGDPPGSPVARPIAGRVVGGRYRLDSVLGRGGMGVVWAGHDEVLHRDVAIKEVIAPGGVDDAAALRARTMREARTAARISADGVVATYDVVEDDGRPWIVMEGLPARTLEDELAERGALPPGEVGVIGTGLLAGLTAAHAAGILHRDVKPANVMFREGPGGRRAVLGDFGIAHFEGDATLTSTGMVMGSPAYVAPERAHGKPATAASDLWSLGVTLWTAVEGRSPFGRGNALATLTAVITEEVPTAQRAGPLAPVLDGLLRKDPSQRIDAGEARRRLLVAVEATGTASPRPTETGPTQPLPIPPRRTAATRAVTPQAPAAVGPASTQGTAPARWAPVPAGAGDAGHHAEDRSGHRSWTLPLIAGAVALGLVGVGSALLRPDDGGAASESPLSRELSAGAPVAPPHAGGEAGTSESGAEAAEEEPGAAEDGPATIGTAEAGPAAEPDGAATVPAPAAADEGSSSQPADTPAGFQRYVDPSGFSVAVPEGWQAEREGPRVYLRDPDSSAYLLVDQTDDPAADPVADWQHQEPAVARRLPNYERIGEIRPVEFRGWDAADWEFVFGQGQGTHVLNRNVITAPDRAYALYWSVPSSQWDALLSTHGQVVGSFQPAT